jgi:hypothetical protein
MGERSEPWTKGETFKFYLLTFYATTTVQFVAVEQLRSFDREKKLLSGAAQLIFVLIALCLKPNRDHFVVLKLLYRLMRWDFF